MPCNMRMGPASKKICESFVSWLPVVIIRRCRFTDSSLLISRWKPRAIFSSTVSTGMPSGNSKYITGNCSSHLATTAAVNKVSLSVKWLYTVSLDTPASRATASMLVLA